MLVALMVALTEEVEAEPAGAELLNGHAGTKEEAPLFFHGSAHGSSNFRRPSPNLPCWAASDQIGRNNKLVAANCAWARG
jgi:hypothetical protein